MASKPNSHRSASRDKWEPATPNHALLRQAILENQIVFATGPQGSGKTFQAFMTGLDLLAKDVKDGGVSRIVVIRPTVTAGEDLGAVPGDVGQKIDPYMEAIYQTIRKSNHPNSQRLLEGDSEDLEFVALQFLRGQTLDDAFIILDEAQNTTPEQMEMALGRLGPNSRMVICGDPDQKDFRKMDGLTDALALFGNDPLFGNVVLDVNDIQRAGIVKHVVLRYNRKRAEIAARAQEQAQRRTLRVA